MPLTDTPRICCIGFAFTAQQQPVQLRLVPLGGEHFITDTIGNVALLLPGAFN